jgi:small subunit ribosomal protein S20
MPQHKSNIKRMRTSAAARLRNRDDRSSCRTMEKRVLLTKDVASAKTELVAAYELLDHMTSKGILHANTAARHKAKLARFVNKLQA